MSFLPVTSLFPCYYLGLCGSDLSSVGADLCVSAVQAASPHRMAAALSTLTLYMLLGTACVVGSHGLEKE